MSVSQERKLQKLGVYPSLAIEENTPEVQLKWSPFILFSSPGKAQNFLWYLRNALLEEWNTKTRPYRLAMLRSEYTTRCTASLPPLNLQLETKILTCCPTHPPNKLAQSSLNHLPTYYQHGSLASEDTHHANEPCCAWAGSLMTTDLSSEACYFAFHWYWHLKFC